MDLEKFCPRCGREVEKLYGEKKKLCARCYPEKHDLLEIPDVVEITVCPVCGRMLRSGEWLEEYTVHEQLGARFAEFSKDDVEMELQYWEEEDRTMVRVHAFKKGMEDSFDSEVRFKKDQCRSCAQFSSGFYKVKLQLRGEAELEPVSNLIVDRAAEITNRNRNKFMSNINKKDSGFNIFLSSEDMAKEILDELRTKYDPEIKRSYELVGEQDGQEVYRNVISVRID